MSLALRVFQRFSFQFKFALQVHGKQFEALTKDISKGGLAFLSEASLTPGDYLNCMLKLMGKAYTFTGEIVVKKTLDNQWMYGISFFDLEEEEAELIGMHHDKIDDMLMDVFLTHEQEGEAQKSAVNRQSTKAQLWTGNLIQHMVLWLEGLTQKTTEELLKMVATKISSLHVNYYLDYKDLLVPATAQKIPASWWNELQKEKSRKLFLKGNQYLLSGPRGFLRMVVEGPLDLTQQKILASTIQIAELLLRYSELFLNLRQIEEEVSIIRLERINKVDHHQNEELQEQIFQHLEEVMQYFHEFQTKEN